SPFTSLSRTLAQLASLLGVILTPYFLSMPSTEAITTLAQSVSGMKPIFTSSFSGLSEPWAQTALRRAGDTPAAPTAAACNTLRRDSLVFSISVITSSLQQQTKEANKKGVRTRHEPCRWGRLRPD